MAKQRYERPVIIKHQTGLANKFGRSNILKTMPFIDGVPVKKLAEKYSSPLFVFSEKQIRKNYRDALRSFSMRYPISFGEGIIPSSNSKALTNARVFSLSVHSNELILFLE